MEKHSAFFRPSIVKKVEVVIEASSPQEISTSGIAVIVATLLTVLVLMDD